MAKYNHEFKRINELKKMEEDIYYIIPDFLYRSITCTRFWIQKI